MENLRIVMPRKGDPDVLEVVREPIPEPGPGEVLVKVLATSASQTDAHIRRGEYPMFKKLPWTLGYDLVGEVAAVGEDVTGFEIGDRVADMPVLGAYARYVVRPAGSLVKAPAEIDPAHEVAVVLSYMTAYQMLHRVAEVGEGDTIVVRGAGGAVGHALVELARHAGARTIGVASGRHHERLRALGAEPVDYTEGDWAEKVRALAPGGARAVFDAIADDGFRRSFSLVARGGRLVAFGFQKLRGARIGLAFLRIWRWNAWPNGKNAGFYNIDGLRKKHPDWFREDLAALFELLGRGVIEPEVSDTMPLERAADAHRRIEEGGLRGKLVLLPS